MLSRCRTPQNGPGLTNKKHFILLFSGLVCTSPPKHASVTRCNNEDDDADDDGSKHAHPNDIRMIQFL